MPPRTRKTPPRVITDREASPAMVAPSGRHLQRGDEVSIVGIRGRCVFWQHVRHESGAEWVDVITSRGNSRYVRPDKIKTVHRARKTGLARAASA